MSDWDAAVLGIIVGEVVVMVGFLVGPHVDRIPGMRFVGRVWDRLAYLFGRGLTATATAIDRLVRWRP